MTDVCIVEAKRLHGEYFGDKLAGDAFAEKYAVKDGDRVFEVDPRQSYDRVAKAIFKYEKKHPNGLPYQVIRQITHNNRFIALQGSPMYGLGNKLQATSLSNCVVVPSPHDSVAGILTTAKQLALLYARRCGVGVDISTLRGRNSKVRNAAGKSTGAVSFADLFSYITRLISMEGRRGALMVSLSVHHPDCLEFIDAKRDLTRITGANVSVRVTHAFMEAVAKGEQYEQRFPVDPSVPAVHSEMVEARMVWDRIVSAARDNAEPGVLFWDTMIRRCPADAYELLRSISTNPCAELQLAAYDSCRLASINLASFVIDAYTANARFDFELYAFVVRAGVRILDDVVDAEVEKLKLLRRKSEQAEERALWDNMIKVAQAGRRLGLGNHGLASMLLKMGIRYDSQEAIDLTETVVRVCRDTAYMASCELATERGAFPLYDYEVEKDNDFIRDLPQNLQGVPRRNVSLMTFAPTGTTSLVSELLVSMSSLDLMGLIPAVAVMMGREYKSCGMWNTQPHITGVSSGMEPFWNMDYLRNRKVEKDADHDFVDANGDAWKAYTVSVPDKGLALKGGLGHEVMVSSGDIKWEFRVKLQATIQKYTDHSISSTVNLPSDTTAERVGEIYLEAWKQGVKGITVYRDGSRSGVLVTDNSANVGTRADAFTPRPDVLPAELFRIMETAVVVGLRDGKPYEVFAVPSFLDKGAEPWQVVKTVEDGVKVYTVQSLSREDIANTVGNESEYSENSSRMASLALRHGVPVQYIVEQLRRSGNRQDYHMSIALKGYIPDGAKVTTDKTCPECGHDAVRYENGCATCMDCGWSKC